MQLPLLLAALAAGVGAAPLIPQSTYLLIAPLPLGILGLATLCRKMKVWPAVITPFFFLTGLSLCHLHLDPPFDPSHIRTFAGPTEISISGRVRAVSKRPSGKTVVDLESNGIGSQKISSRVHGNLRVYVSEGDVGLLPGDDIRFVSRIRLPRRYGVPGEFDMPRHLASRSIYATSFVKDATALAKIANLQTSSNIVGRWRARIESVIEESVPQSARPLVKALTIGEKNDISQEAREIMAAGGISHLFAISGLHLGTVAIFLYLLGVSICRRSTYLLTRGPPKRYLPLALLPILWIYLLLTGEAIATQRAFMMACGGAVLLFAARRSSPLHLLATIAFFLLLSNPLLLFEPAFQLSFTAVAGLMILLPRWTPFTSTLPPFTRKAVSLILATSAATLSTAPIVIYHFHHFPISTLLCNLLAVPLVTFVALPAGLAGIVATPFVPSVAGLFFQGCGLILSATLAITKEITETPGLASVALYTSPTETLAIVLVAVAILLPKKRQQLRRVACFVAFLIFIFPEMSASELRVTVLSVGQGDSIVLSLDNEKHYLIDGGGLFSNSFDVGERLVAPALGRLGIKRLEGVILTHDHPDHWKGLPYILRHFNVASFWTNLADEEIPESVLDILVKEKIPIERPEPGWSPVPSESKSSLALFAPSEGKSSENNRSLSLYASLGEEGILLTGDIEASGVEELAASPPAGIVTLLKIPHHGSRKSAPKRLLDSFPAKLLFVSLGEGNRYSFPHEEVTRAIRAKGLPLFRTDRLGTVTFSTTGRGWAVESHERGVLD